MLGLIISGAFTIENIFSIAGIGRYFVTAVRARDDGVVMGLTVVITLTIIVGNLLADILHAFLDPRVRDRR
jgi:ABC-type dipeptide/oligopeptide/nickel transport system permease component